MHKAKCYHRAEAPQGMRAGSAAPRLRGSKSSRNTKATVNAQHFPQTISQHISTVNEPILSIVYPDGQRTDYNTIRLPSLIKAVFSLLPLSRLRRQLACLGAPRLTVDFILIAMTGAPRHREIILVLCRKNRSEKVEKAIAGLLTKSAGGV